VSATIYLFTANIIVWVGIAGYVAFLATRTSTLEKRVGQLELLGDEHGDG